MNCTEAKEILHKNSRIAHQHPTKNVTHKEKSAKTFQLHVPQEEAVSVSGHHVSHGSTSIVSMSVLSRSVPGTNPLKILAQFPGIQFTSDDPQGVDTYSNQLYMHGFKQDQIGMTLDGIPLGDQEFHSANGLNSVTAISSENVGRMDVSMSAGAEDIASTSSLGGAIQFISSDPKHKSSANIGQTFGSNALFHTFVRLDSGDLNKAGGRFYVSYMRNDTKMWKGGGEQFMQQVNAKFVQPIGEKSSISAYFDWSDLQEENYQDYSFNMLHKGGYNIDNFIGTPGGYAKAYNLALAIRGSSGGNIPAGYSRLSDPYDASYYDSTAMQEDFLGGLNLNLALTDRIKWKTTIYGHAQSSRGSYTSPYITSPNGAPLAEQITQPQLQRFGITSSLNYHVSHNDIQSGIWYENDNYSIGRYAYEEPLLGQGSPINAFGSLPSAFAHLWGQQFNTNTFTAFVEDTYHILPNVSLHAGFKSMLSTSTAGETANDESYTGVSALVGGVGMTTAKAFLPHISGDWHFFKNHELFFDVSENAKALPVSGYKLGASPFSVSQSVFNEYKTSYKPETDWNYAVGYHYTSKIIQGTLFAYHTNFHNRLQQITSGTITNPVSTVVNVGGVTMNGVDAGVTINPVRGLSIYNSISYSHATYDNNVNTTGTNGYVVNYTKGEQIVAYPRLMYKSSISYEWRNFDMHLDEQYVGKRNFSYVGDMKSPSYWLSNFGMRYQLKDVGSIFGGHKAMKTLSLDFNIYNLTGIRYIATMGENGFPMSGDDQSFLLGAPRQFFGSVKATF